MAGHAHAHGEPHVHVTPLKVYITIFVTLMVMTAITVAAAYVDLGAMNTIVALAIASFKATLVVLYFMHVRHASRLTKLIVVTGLFFLGILLGETMMDYSTRMWINPPALLQ